METLKEQKDKLRKKIRLCKTAFSTEELQQCSALICEQLLKLKEVQKSDTIFLYYSMTDEVNTHSLVQQLASQGKTILLPKVVDDAHMVLIPFSGEENLVPAGPYHILEPIGKPFTLYDKIDLAIVPGIAFDGNGRRLGHGKAYYDRELLNMPKAYKIGICFSFQMVENVPVGPFDIAMNRVVHD